MSYESNVSWFSYNTEFSFEVSGSRNKASYSASEVILIVIVTGVLSLGTVVGNIMVMISFKMDKQLQTISNYFLLSLAIADLWIGLVSMPLFTMYTLLGFWPLGSMICDTWLAFDYLNSNASVLNLLIISFDRYFSVTRPLTYRAKRTTRRAAFMIACAWIISLVLWPPWIYSWPYIEGQRKVPEDECFIQFLETNLYITFGTAIAAFYVPVTVMCVLYWRIWKETEQRKKDLTHLQAGQKDVRRKSSSNGYPGEEDRCQRARSDSCIANKVNYVSPSICVEPPKQFSSQEKSRPRKVKEVLMTWCKIDQDLDGQDENSTSHESPGTVTLSSTETPVRSSRTTSLTFQSFQQVLHCGERGFTLNNQNRPCRSESTTVLSNLPSSNHSFSSDAIYIILIRLPSQPSVEGEGESKASVKMILEEDKNTKISKQTVRGPDSLETLAVQHPANVGLRPNSLCVSESAIDTIRLSLNTKLFQKQVAKHRVPKKKRKQQERKQEKKAAKTLSAILLAFIVTWTPYNVLVLVKTLSPCANNECIPEGLWNFAYYLCYINSTVNPICYALCNANFRKTYIRILSCK